MSFLVVLEKTCTFADVAAEEEERFIVTWDAHCARTWDATSGDALEVMNVLSGPVRGVSFSDAGKLLIMLDEGVVVWRQESNARDSSRGASLSRLWRTGLGPSASGGETT